MQAILPVIQTQTCGNDFVFPLFSSFQAIL